MEQELLKKTKVINKQLATHIRFIYNKHKETGNHYFLIINIKNTKGEFIQLMCDSQDYVFAEAVGYKVYTDVEISKTKKVKLEKLGWEKPKDYFMYQRFYSLFDYNLKQISDSLVNTLIKVYGYKFEDKLGFEIGYQEPTPKLTIWDRVKKTIGAIKRIRVRIEILEE